MTPESILNLVWAALCLVVMAALLPKCRRSYHRASLARLRWDCAFLVIIVALFFCLSASDDIIRMRFLLHHRSSYNKMHLARMLDLPREDQQVPLVYQFVMALNLLAILAPVNVSVCQRFLPSSVGRSPPLLPAVL